MKEVIRHCCYCGVRCPHLAQIGVGSVGARHAVPLQGMLNIHNELNEEYSQQIKQIKSSHLSLVTGHWCFEYHCRGEAFLPSTPRCYDLTKMLRP